MSNLASNEPDLDSIYLAGELAPAGLYQRIGTTQTVRLNRHDYLPASLDGRVACYARARRSAAGRGLTSRWNYGAQRQVIPELAAKRKIEGSVVQKRACPVLEQSRKFGRCDSSGEVTTFQCGAAKQEDRLSVALGFKC